MQYNLPLSRQMTGQKHAKLLEVFIYIYKIAPWDPQANESNFEKIDLWGILHAKGNTKSSSEETPVAKELVLVILKLWH